MSKLCKLFIISKIHRLFNRLIIKLTHFDMKSCIQKEKKNIYCQSSSHFPQCSCNTVKIVKVSFLYLSVFNFEDDWSLFLLDRLVIHCITN